MQSLNRGIHRAPAWWGHRVYDLMRLCWGSVVCPFYSFCAAIMWSQDWRSERSRVLTVDVYEVDECSSFQFVLLFIYMFISFHFHCTIC